MKSNTFTPDSLQKIRAYWRAANYVSVGQIYLYDNALLKRPLKLSDVKPLVVGHWGTTPGQNFIYVHLNRVIKKYDLDMFYIAGPGHGAPAIVRGYKEEGTITTPFDMRVQNEIDRFHLGKDVVDRVPNLGSKGDYLKQQMKDKLIEHKHYVDKHGQDLPEIRNWKWSATPAGNSSANLAADGHKAVPELNRIKVLKNADSHK